MKGLTLKTSNGQKTDTCRFHGDFDNIGKDDSLPFFLRCPKCLERAKKQEAQREKLKAEAKENRREQILLSSGVPKRFKDCSFESYQPNRDSQKAFSLMNKYREKFSSIKENGTSMILCGKPGTGKTHLACAVLLYLIGQHFYAKYATSYKMLAEIKSTYNKTSLKTDTEIIEKYSSCDLLIIDEVGVQFGSEAEKVLFYQIINGRYENVLPTILISNLNKDGVKEFIGERCFDRLQEGNGVVLPFDWGSYRK